MNGIESEGWPNLGDWDFDDWSGGLNRHNFWTANAHPPAFSYVNHEWLEQSVPLSPWTGRQVRLKFVADCGPNNNATTDHAFWGNVRLLPAGVDENELTAPKSHMTWLNDRPFTSTFYFLKR